MLLIMAKIPSNCGAVVGSASGCGAPESTKNLGTVWSFACIVSVKVLLLIGETIDLVLPNFMDFIYFCG